MKGHNMKKLMLAFILIFLALISGCEKKTEDIKIGVISELTGPISAFGKRAFNGIELATSEINASGGINGRKINLIVEDDQSIPQKAATSAKKLIEINKVSVIVGMVGSGLGMSVAPIANESKIPLIACGVSTPKYSTASDYTFRIRGNSQKEIQILAALAFNKYNTRKLAILNVQNEYGVSYKEVFKKSYVELGGKVIIDESYQSGSSDFRTQLTKIKNSGEDGIYLVAQGAENGYALKQMKELGIKAKIYATVGMEVPEAIQTGGSALDGVLYTTTGFDPTVDNELIRKFNSNYKKKYGENSDLFSAEGYDALKIVANILTKGTTEPGEIKEELYKLKDFPGVTGSITFNQFGDPINRNIFLKTIKNNQYIILEKNP